MTLCITSNKNESEIFKLGQNVGQCEWLLEKLSKVSSDFLFWEDQPVFFVGAIQKWFCNFGLIQFLIQQAADNRTTTVNFHIMDTLFGLLPL